MEKWKKVIVRGKEKENFYCREDSKGKLEYRYRVHQQDAMGKMVDTWKKQDDKRQPFRTLREAEIHRKAFIEEIMGRTERNMSVPDLHTLQEIYDDYVGKRGVTLSPASLSKHNGNMKNHITPHFKNRRIGSITAGEIKNFITGLREMQAYETSKSILATMAKVWKYGYELGIVDRDRYIELFVDKLTKVEVVKQVVGKVWTCIVPADKLPMYEMQLRIINQRGEDNNQVSIRYLADEAKISGSVMAPPRLEDLYLWLFPQENISKEEK